MAIIKLSVLFLGSLLVIAVLASSLNLPPMHRLLMNPSKEEIHVTSVQLSVLMEEYRYRVTLIFVLLYILLQSFAIPGPVILSVLAGSLFGKMYGVIIVTFCTVIGSVLCRINFHTLGYDIAMKYYGKAINGIKMRFIGEGGVGWYNDLFWYFLFLRITPIVPNWLLNMSSGIVGIPYWIFVVGTLVGLLPNNIVFVSIGAEIGESVAGQGGGGSIFEFSPGRFISLLGVSVAALIPVVVKKLVGRDGKGKGKGERAL
jgi:uncharacterized membrane protein YdjX (TVP38/TMEM64 family)